MTSQSTNTGTGNLASLISAFGPLFVGSGKTTATSIPNASTLNTSNSIISQALSNASDAEGQTSDIVSRIIAKNAEAFTTTAIGQNTAGLYNSTVLSQLNSEAQADSTAAAVDPVLKYQTQQLQIANQATDAQLAANKTTTSQTAAAISPLITAALGAGTLGISAVSNWSKISSALGLGGPSTPAASANIAPISQGGTSIGAGNGLPQGVTFASPNPGAGNVSVGGTVGDPGQYGGGALDNVESSDAAIQNLSAGQTPVSGVQSGAASIDGNAALTTNTIAPLDSGDLAVVANSTADSAALAGGTAGVTLDAATDIAPFAADAGETAAVAGGTDAAVAAAGTDAAVAAGTAEVAAAPEEAAAGDALVEALPAIAASIVCTELAAQGKLDKKALAASTKHFRGYKQCSIDAYYIWSKPTVLYLRAFPNSSFSKFLQTVFNERSNFIYKKKKTLTGLVAYTGVSFVTGLALIFLLVPKKLFSLLQLKKVVKANG